MYKFIHVQTVLTLEVAGQFCNFPSSRPCDREVWGEMGRGKEGGSLDIDMYGCRNYLSASSFLDLWSIGIVRERVILTCTGGGRASQQHRAEDDECDFATSANAGRHPT